MSETKQAPTTATTVVKPPSATSSENRMEPSPLELDSPGRTKAKQILKQSTAASNMSHTTEALTIVVLGASGDLAKKKTYPSLLKLYLSGYLPSSCSIIGFARSDYSDESFRVRLGKILAGIGGSEGDEQLNSFLQLCSYCRGKGYDDPEAWTLVNSHASSIEASYEVANRVFYFAVPPDVFAAAGSAIKSKCMSKNGWNRMIIEKPFGRDSESSKLLGERLSRSFSEDQLYRIDHYLGKEVVQNFMVLRFGNIFLQPLWNRDYVKSVIITFKEDIGTNGRGGYFDNYGIIRDVMQNHLLQILSLVAMEPPVRVSGEGYANFVRDEKVKALRCIPPLKLDDVLLGQYVREGDEPGYLEDPTVPEGSICPTYCLAKFNVNNARWAGVPFIMKAGKALDKRKCEIRIQFKQPPGSSSMFESKIPLNELVIRVQPDDAIYIKMNVKTPGFKTKPVETDMDLSYDEKFPDVKLPDAYTRLILDVLRGEQATFVRGDELEAAWAIFTPLLNRIENEKIKPFNYKFGSRGPRQADEMMKMYYERSEDYMYKGRQYGSSSIDMTEASNL